MQKLFNVLAPDSEDWRLAERLDPVRLPAHIAVIMDGNGRWANQRHLPRIAGHKAGVDSVRSIMETCARLDIRVLTLYAFSTENWKRPRAEVEFLFRLLRHYLRDELATLQENNIRLQAIGRIADLPRDARRELDHVIDATRSNTGLRVNLALNYSGRAELLDAVNRLVERAALTGQPREITEEVLSGELSTAGLPDPDLLIRTSGEMRISNFLLWQIAYAELYVTETLWPDFRTRDLLEALGDFQRRDRRFGGLGTAATVPPLPIDEAAEALLPAR